MNIHKISFSQDTSESIIEDSSLPRISLSARSNHNQNVKKQAVEMMGNPWAVNKKTEGEPRTISRALAILLSGTIMLTSPGLTGKTATNKPSGKRKVAEMSIHLELGNLSEVKIKRQKQMRIADAFEKIKTNREVISLVEGPRTATGDHKSDTMPREITFDKGTSNIAFEGYQKTEVSEKSMRILKVGEFDGTEIDIATKSPKEGWIHYIISEKFDGFLFVLEPQVDSITIGAIGFDSGTIYKPLKFIQDDFGNFLLLGTEGMIGRVDGTLGYIPLKEVFGVKNKLEGIKIEDEKNSNGIKIKSTITAKNSTGRYEINYDSDAKMDTFVPIDGISIIQR